MSPLSPELQYDRFLIDQLLRPIANLYRITPLAAGETPAGPPVAFVRQRKLAVREDIRFFADEGETTELFRIAARQWLDTGGSKYDVVAADGERLGVLHHTLRSFIRTTWSVQDGSEQELAVVQERSFVGAILRRAVDFFPDYGSLIPIPYNFDILGAGEVIGRMDRKFQVRDRYVLDLSGDVERRIDRRVAIALAVGLDALQNR
jgi:uncharacterized protein YxjI